MLYLIIALFIKRNPKARASFRLVLLNTKIYGLLFLRRFFVVVGCSISSFAATGQQLAYDVIKGGQIIGKIKITKYQADSTTHMKLFSSVKTSLLVRINVNSWEESAFRHGTLIYSSLKREINGRNQIDRHIKWNKTAYDIWDDGKVGVIQSPPITQNIIRLYYTEPVTERRIFSESEKRWVPIEKVAAHHYRLLLSGGSYNEFFYTNGICSKVAVNNKFFKATFKLAE